MSQTTLSKARESLECSIRAWETHDDHRFAIQELHDAVESILLHLEQLEEQRAEPPLRAHNLRKIK